MLLATQTGRFDAARLEHGCSRCFPVLKQNWQQAAGELSGGQKQMLAISRAHGGATPLLVVDEPTKGLAPAMIEHLIDGVPRTEGARDTTILLVEQNFHMARSLGDRVAVMDDGRIVHSGNMANWPRTRRCSTACSACPWTRHQ